jgi:hypothetical protein
VPEQESGDDSGNEEEDEVGLPQVAALEALGALDLADRRRPDHREQHEDGEHVDHQREPALVTEPGEGRVLVDGADHGDHDRGEEDEEAPEDRRVDDAGDQPLEEFALAEDDGGLVLRARAEVVVARRGLAHPDEGYEQSRTTGKEEAGDGERRGERDGSERDVYRPAPARIAPPAAARIAPPAAARIAPPAAARIALPAAARIAPPATIRTAPASARR